MYGWSLILAINTIGNWYIAGGNRKNFGVFKIAASHDTGHPTGQRRASLEASLGILNQASS